MIWLLLLVVFLCVSPAFGQRDAPVWEAYLPQFSIYHDQSKGQDAITIDFLFKKNGGPVEHIEHQAYILVYLKKDEEQILKLAGDSRLVNKETRRPASRFSTSWSRKNWWFRLTHKSPKLIRGTGPCRDFPMSGETLDAAESTRSRNSAFPSHLPSRTKRFSSQSES
jgi:hypothetical protein